MRKNCRQVLNAWTAGDRWHDTNSVWTDGKDVYSYDTCILTEDDEGRAIINRTYYSNTTSQHAVALVDALSRGEREIRTVEGMPFGATPNELRRRAAESWREPGVEYPRETA